MNAAATSREALLDASRELVRRRGWSAVSIRSVATACGVSVGTVYNYFDSKSELAGAVVESIWHEVFHRSSDEPAFTDALSCISWMYGCVERGSELYPGFLNLHALAFAREDKPGGRRLMQRARRHILEELRSVLERDSRVRPGALGGDLTADAFASMLLSLVLSAPPRGGYGRDAVLEVARRVLY